MTKWNTGHDIADVRSLLECYVEFSITSVSNKCFFLDSVHSFSINPDTQGGYWLPLP